MKTQAALKKDYYHSVGLLVKAKAWRTWKKSRACYTVPFTVWWDAQIDEAIKAWHVKEIK